jgi:hypothetical protein
LTVRYGHRGVPWRITGVERTVVRLRPS